MGHHHDRRAESRDVMATDMAALSLFNRGREGGRDAATVIRHAKGDAGIRQVATWQGRGWPNRVLKELGKVATASVHVRGFVSVVSVQERK